MNSAQLELACNWRNWGVDGPGVEAVSSAGEGVEAVAVRGPPTYEFGKAYRSLDDDRQSERSVAHRQERVLGQLKRAPPTSPHPHFKPKPRQQRNSSLGERIVLIQDKVRGKGGGSYSESGRERALGSKGKGKV